MRLKITDLQRVVKEAVQEKKAEAEFCNEIKVAFGPTVVVSDKLEQLAEQANYRLDVLERTGRREYIKFSPDLALEMAGHKTPVVRKLVARLLPESMVGKLAFDKDPSVRFAALSRSSASVVREATQKYPSDYEIKGLYQSKILLEREDSALKSTAKSPPGEQFMSDGWYERTARKLVQDYGRTLDTGWVPNAVNQLCMSMRSVNRFNVDPYKLLKTVVEVISDAEEDRLEKLDLNESVSEPYRNVDEDVDPVVSLVESRLSSAEYIKKAESVFNVKLSTNESKLPSFAVLPHGSSPRFVDEQALDVYVKHWNTRLSLNGKPYSLSWSPSLSQSSRIQFRVEKKND